MDACRVVPISLVGSETVRRKIVVNPDNDPPSYFGVSLFANDVLDIRIVSFQR